MIHLNVSNTFYDGDQDGNPDLVGELPGWQNFGLFIINGISFANTSTGFQNEETGWTYTQSILQGFYLLESTQIDGIEVESGDVIGAFKDDKCVGWVYADPNGYTTIPLMGDDQVNTDLDGYMLNGDVAELLICLLYTSPSPRDG